MDAAPLTQPGSEGEHELQLRYRTQDRAGRFYRDQVLDRLNGEGRAWGTDDARAKGGDYFGAACEPRLWLPG
jgi:hypothetical protein